MPELQKRTVQCFPLSLKADIGPSSINDAERTADLILTTVAPVKRYDWMTGKTYLEVLSMDPAHVRLDRMNGGAPLLDSHNAYSVADILGTVVPGSVSTTKKALLATVRFAKAEDDPEADRVFRKVKDRIIRDVSIGYRVYAYDEKPGKGDGALPIRTATDWEPFECSLVPIPADASAKVRAGHEPTDANPCEIVTRGAEEPAQPAATQTPASPAKEQTTMKDEIRSETIVVPPTLQTPTPAPAPTAPNDRDLGARQERDRVEGIRAACEAGRMTRAFEAQLISTGVSLLDAQGRVLEELRKRDLDVPRSSDRAPDVRVVGEDPLVHVRAGIENALLHRLYPRPYVDAKTGFELTEVGRQYRGLNLLRIAEAYIAHRGARTTGMSKMDIVTVALGLDMARGGMHTTSDFPLLLADVANKLLRQAYAEAPQTFTAFSRQVSLPDFKMANRVQLGEAPALEEILEHGEYKDGTIGEGREQFQLKSYGKKFSITRRALINDDTDAFSRVPMMFGRSARNLESDLVYAQITSNPLMGDGLALFIAAHANLAAPGTVISIASIGAGREAMRIQTGVDGTTRLNINPVILLVPASLETLADQFVSTNLLANAAGAVNPFAGRLRVVAEPRLDANSRIAWYLTADTGQIDVVEYAYLEGETGPRVESRVGFDVDGLEVKCGHDFAAKVIDWRGLYRNPGA